MAAFAPCLQLRIKGGLAALVVVASLSLTASAFGLVSPEPTCEDGEAAVAAVPLSGDITSQLPGAGEEGSRLGLLRVGQDMSVPTDDPLPGWPGRVGLALRGTRAAARPFDVLLGSSPTSRRQARLYRFSHSDGSLRVKGDLLDVGLQFSPSANTSEGGQAEEAELLEEYVGKRGLDLSAEWRLAPGFSLSTSQARRRSNDHLDESYGLTTTAAEHSVSLDVGSGGKLRAGLNLHREEWDRWLGKRGEERRERTVKFETPLGGFETGTLALATSTVESGNGVQKEQERTTEAHMNLAPTGRLRLTADFRSKVASGEEAETTKAVGALFHLVPGTEMSATLKRISSSGRDTNETGLGLAAKLSCGHLKIEETLAAGSEGPVRTRGYSFAGGFGRGAARASVRGEFHENRAEGPDGKLERARMLHLDRSLGSSLKLSLDHRGKISGSNAESSQEAETSCKLAGDLRGWGNLVANLAIGRNMDGDGIARRRVSLSREWRSVRARLEQSTWRVGSGQGSVVTCGLDIPTADLPEWAESVSSSRQFSDAAEYLIPEQQVWGKPDISFGGYRLWVARRDGGEDNGRDTFGFAHRRVIAGRYHVLLALEDAPEATNGGMQGRPLALRRHTLEVGARMGEDVAGRCGYAVDTPTDGSAGGLERAGVAVWGKLAEGEQVEGDLSYESGQWEGEARERTSVSILYSRDVGEEHQVEFKAGYAWGEHAGDGGGRDCRLTFRYEKPL